MPRCKNTMISWGAITANMVRACHPSWVAGPVSQVSNLQRSTTVDTLTAVSSQLSRPDATVLSTDQLLKHTSLGATRLRRLPTALPMQERWRRART